MATNSDKSTSEVAKPARHRRTGPPESPNTIEPSRAAVRWLYWALSRFTNEGPAARSRDAPIGARIGKAGEGPVERQRGATPGAVPEEVRARFVRVGRDYHFPSGAQAFRDHGHKVTSHSENVAVVRALVQIAAERGWTEITVTGTDRFRTEVWRIATLSGLTVRGYRPTEFEKQKLVRNVAGEREPPRPTQGPSPATPRQKRGEPAYKGILLEHGPAPYQFHPQGNPSYYVRIRTEADGPLVLWGKDLERALRDAKVTAGEEIRIKQSGRDAVNVKRKELDATGKVTRERDVKAHRNHWEVHGITRARQADLTSNPDGPGVPAASLALKGAQLFAKQYIRDPAQREVFVKAVSDELTRIVDRGGVVPKARLRERTAKEATLARSV
jgi:hypothetical protein